MGDMATTLVGEAIKIVYSMACRKIKFATVSNMEELRKWNDDFQNLLKNEDPLKEGREIEKVRSVMDMLDTLLDERATRDEQKKVMGSRRFADVELIKSSLLSPFRFARKYNKITKEIQSLRSYISLGADFAVAVQSSAGNQNQGCSLYVGDGPKLTEAVNRRSNLYVGDGPILTEVVFGRDRDRDNIIPLLCDSNDQESVSVAAIVGIGGQGKTVLAQYIYNDENVKGCFDVMLWVSCDPYTSFSGVVGIILEHVTAQLHLQFSHARSTSEGRKYLLVLDNIWFEENLKEPWETLKTSLGVGGCLGASKSRVLITTRSKKVAGIMDVPKPYMLNDLDKSDSLLLLRQFARVKGQNPAGVEAIEKEIVELCPKVPLVLKNIGCQLAHRDEIKQWQDFKDKLASTSIFQEGHGKVLEILKLSYVQLVDEKLKSCAACVAFCSLLPQRKFASDKMVVYWKALGFVGSEADGEKLIITLGNYGFFDVYNCGSFKLFSLHDVMYDLITWIGKSKHQNIHSKTKEITEGVRHVSVDKSEDPHWEVLLPKLKGGKQLKSILTVYRNRYKRRERGMKLSDIEKIISKFPHLKVLELRAEEIGKVPKSIDQLFHLRHLNLSMNPMRKLPNSITKLLNLLSLDLSYCKNLEELPKDMGKMLNLTQLRLKEVCNLRYMPKGIGNLTKLQTLDVFVVGEKRSSRGSKSKVGAKLEELGHLNNLKGSLRIHVRRQSKDIVLEAREAHLKKKTQLTGLEVVFEKGDEEDEKFLEGLQPSGEQLEFLDIQNYGSKMLPFWITGRLLPKLQQLSLSDIPELEEVPEVFRDFSSVTHLSILGCPKLKGIPNWIDSLSSLMMITIHNASEMEALPESIGSLNSLISLELCGCPGLESLPHQISNLGRLNNLEIDGCSKLLFERSTGEYWPYLKHLYNLYIISSEGDTFENHGPS